MSRRDTSNTTRVCVKKTLNILRFKTSSRPGFTTHSKSVWCWDIIEKINTDNIINDFKSKLSINCIISS